MSSSAAYKQVFEGQDPEPGDRYIGGIPYLGLLVDLCSDISYAVLDQVTDPKSKYFTNAVQCIVHIERLLKFGKFNFPLFACGLGYICSC